MLITVADMLKDKALLAKLKSWAAQLNLNAKAPGCPTFKVNGPRQITARGRKAGPASQKPFMGDEEFRLSSIFIDRDTHKDGITVSAILTPVDLNLAAEVSSVTVLMSDAIEVFSEFEAWVGLASVEPKPTPPPGARKEALPTVEETRASETWGAW